MAARESRRGVFNCYAVVNLAVLTRGVQWGKGSPRHRTSESYWRQPFAWDREAVRTKTRLRVFCGSLCDWADEEAPAHWRRELWTEVISQTPNLDWLMLTKRVGHAVEFILKERPFCHDNVWFGCSAEDQLRWDERVPELMRVRQFFPVLFVSAEPLLGPINMTLRRDVPAWVIFGGESIGGRKCDVRWIRDGIEQCRRTGMTPFVKQLGSNPVDGSLMSLDADRMRLRLKDAKGGEMDEWPPDLRVREFPRVKGLLSAPAQGTLPIEI